MDTATKRNRIKEIRDEVRVFHPLLETILPKLPGISSYEYTHGPNERGADFVLERTDVALDRKTYIGVVAKTTKITADIRDVEEQICECAEKRRYKGMSSVRCTEVWVFCAQGYSERAKEKIERRFSERTIQFFGPEDCVKFVDDHHPYFWFDLPYKLGNYFQSLSQRLDDLDASTAVVSFPGVDAINIELDTFERVKKGYRERRPGAEYRNVNFLREAKLSRLSILEAEMGFGKSRLVRRLARSMCSADSYRKDHVVPVFSSFKQFVEKYEGDLDKLIGASIGESTEVLRDPAVTIICILDGLDEVNSEDRSTTQWFEALADATKIKSNLRLFIATRPSKSLEEKLALNHDARSFGIRPLSLTKMIKYLEQCCSKANLPKRLFEDLKKSSLFRQLPKSPISAALFSNLLSQNQQEVPQSLTELYSKSMDLMLGRWEQKKCLVTEKKFQTAELVAERLAEYFIDNQLVYIAEAEAVEQIHGYFSKRSIGIDETEIVSLLFERSNIFARDLEMGTISFRHHSFAEFLCAKRKYRERNLNVKEIALKPAWINVMFFYAGLRLDCADLLAIVQCLVPRNESEEWMKIIAVPSYLLAAYQTEFRIVEENSHLILIGAAKLYLKVRRGETKTLLADLSEMYLLYLFKSLIVESVAYKYFEKAFDSVAMYIQNSSNDDEIKHYALFFLGCAAIDLGNQNVFKYIIEDIGAAKLPLAISLAIRMELETHTNLGNSKLLRRHRAHLQKVLIPSAKVNKGQEIASRKRIKEMFEKPIGVGGKTRRS